MKQVAGNRPMTILLCICVAVAASGFVLTAFVHAQALLGERLPGPGVTRLAIIAMIPIWVIAVLVDRGAPNEDTWRSMLRCAPRWRRWLIYAVWAYAAVHLFIGMGHRVDTAESGPLGLSGGRLVMVTALWLPFYLAAALIFLSVATQRRAASAGFCPEGHRVGPDAQYCETCGRPMGSSVGDNGASSGVSR